MKRIISLVFALAITLTFMLSSLTASAQVVYKGKMEVAVISANPKDTVIVPISFNENPGIMAVTIDFTYDSSVLEYVKFYKGNVVSDYGVAAYPEQNRVRFVSCQNSNDTLKNGTFISLEFKVKENAKAGLSEISVKYTNGDFCNKNLDRIMPKIISGGVKVAFNGSNCEHKSYNEWEKVAEPTCEAGGTEQHYCLACGHSESREIEKTGHNFDDDWVIKTPATKDSDGVMVRYCIFCQKAETRNYTLEQSDDENIPNQKDDIISNDKVEDILGEQKPQEEEKNPVKDLDDLISQIAPELQPEGEMGVMEKIEESVPALKKILNFFEMILLFVFRLIFV